MANEDNSLWVVFNGEIYNHAEIREELERLGDPAAPALRKARGEATSLESRRRLDQLLERLERPPTVPEQVRSLRAVELLEHMAGRDAENEAHHMNSRTATTTSKAAKAKVSVRLWSRC